MTSKPRYKIIPPSRLQLNLREVWEYRELVYFFSWRDIKVKYKQTFLGILWVVLQPCLLVLLFVGIFGNLTPASSESRTGYAAYVLSALVFWQLFSSIISATGESMLSNGPILKKIYFPRLIIPLSIVLTALVDFIVSIVVFLILCLVFSQPISLYHIPHFMAAIVLDILLAFSLGSIIGTLNVKYRDFRYVVPFILQLLFFATPIVYKVVVFKNELIRKLLMVNPVSAVIELSRSLLSSEPPNYQVILTGIVTTLILFVTALVYFKRAEAYFADSL